MVIRWCMHVGQREVCNVRRGKGKRCQLFSVHATQGGKNGFDQGEGKFTRGPVVLIYSVGGVKKKGL